MVIVSPAVQMCGKSAFQAVPFFSAAAGATEGMAGGEIAVMGAMAVLLGLALWKLKGLRAAAFLAAEREEALRKSHERYRRLVEASSEGIWMGDRELRTTYVNGRMAEMLGYSPEEMVGQGLGEFVCKSSGEKDSALLLGGAAEGKFDFCFRHRDGLDFWAIISTKALHDHEGRFVGTMAMLTDITERKRVEEALREAQRIARLRCWAWDVVTGEITWSDEAQQSRAEEGGGVAPRNFAAYESQFFPESWARLQKAVEGAIATGTAYELELELKGSGGASRWIIGRGEAVRDGMGKVIRLLGTSQEITERKRVEEALRRSEVKSNLAIGAADLGIWDWNPMTGELVWSDRCKAMFGVFVENNPGIETFMETVHPDDRSFVKSTIDHALAELTDYRMEYRIKWPDGTLRWITTCGRVSRDAQGKTVRVTGTAQDVTGQKQAQAELQRFNAELERHVELRTAELQEANRGLREEISARRRLEKEILEISEREQRRLGQDLHDGLGQELAGISLLAKVHANRLTSHANPEDRAAHEISKLVSESIVIARDLAKGLYPIELERGGLIAALEEMALQTSRRFRVACELKLNGWVPRFEREAEIHLYRIVQACIGNALRHGYADRITIEFCEREESQLLSINDNGVGFEKRRAEQNAGIGLHIMHYRARVIGARLEMRGSLEGGCNVCCHLPRL